MNMAEITPGETYACKLPEYLRRAKPKYARPWKVIVLATGCPRHVKGGRVGAARDGVMVHCVATGAQHMVAARELLRQFDDQLDFKQRQARYNEQYQQWDEQSDQLMQERHARLAGALEAAGADASLLGVKDPSKISRLHSYHFKPHELLELLSALGHADADAFDELLEPEPPAQPRRAEQLAKDAAKTPGRRPPELAHLAVAAQIVAQLCDESPRDLAADEMVRERLDDALSNVQENMRWTALYHLGTHGYAWETDGQGWQLSALGCELIELVGEPLPEIAAEATHA